MQSRHIFIYTFLQLHQDWLWAAPSLTFNVHQGLFPKWYNGQSVKLPIDTNLVLNLRMSDAIAPVTHISLHGKQRDNFIFSNHNFMSLRGKY